jgi:uncharacterized NAD(P)/FAD-binding protein YdhS
MTRIVIIGGGCAAALLVAHLGQGEEPVDLVVVEPSGQVGRGGAYSTRDERHLLNVRAGSLGATTARVDDFARWSAADGVDLDAHPFQPRHRYGSYLHEQFEAGAARLRAMGGSVEVLETSVIDVRRSERYDVELVGGERIVADHVVLAIGPPPSRLDPRIGVAAGELAFADPWQAGALEPTAGPVLLVGTGLTAIDAALSICAAHADAMVVACSRRGLVPFAHDRVAPDPSVVDLEPFERAGRTIEGYVEAWRVAVAQAGRSGQDWRAVVDALRPCTQELWRALDIREQRRFLDEVARAWDVRRHRMAPDVAEAVDSLVAEGRLRFVGAAIDRVERRGDRVSVRLGRATDPVDPSELAVARIIGCTGFGQEVARHPDPLVRALLRRGLAVPDALGLGLSAERHGRLGTRMGRRAGRIHVIGALRRGELLESTAVPELRDQAAAIAGVLVGDARAGREQVSRRGRARARAAGHRRTTTSTE